MAVYYIIHTLICLYLIDVTLTVIDKGHAIIFDFAEYDKKIKSGW